MKGMTFKEFRGSFGLTQVQFADNFGIPLSTVQSWEQGKRKPPSYVFDFITKITMMKIMDDMYVHNTVYGMLVRAFGLDDVFEHYVVEGYGICSFYIKSRNLFIDLKTTFMHQGCWFNEHDASHLDMIQALSMAGYDEIGVWTDEDCNQREFAEEHSWNYVVFWREDLADVHAWFAMGCPDGKDWEIEYSWLGTNECISALDDARYIYLCGDGEILEFEDYDIHVELYMDYDEMLECQSAQICYDQLHEDDDRFLCAHFFKDACSFFVDEAPFIHYIMAKKSC